MGKDELIPINGKGLNRIITRLTSGFPRLDDTLASLCNRADIGSKAAKIDLRSEEATKRRFAQFVTQTGPEHIGQVLKRKVELIGYELLVYPYEGNKEAIAPHKNSKVHEAA